jgi:hypothetical protein
VLIRLGLVLLLQLEKWLMSWRRGGWLEEDFRSATQRLHSINARDCILSLLEAVMLADMQRPNYHHRPCWGFPLQLLLHPSCGVMAAVSLVRLYHTSMAHPNVLTPVLLLLDPKLLYRFRRHDTEHRVYALFGCEGRWSQRARKVHRCPYCGSSTADKETSA